MQSYHFLLYALVKVKYSTLFDLKNNFRVLATTSNTGKYESVESEVMTILKITWRE
jgi:hypothetical protein